jgi:hypothetical protein
MGEPRRAKVIDKLRRHTGGVAHDQARQQTARACGQGDNGLSQTCPQVPRGSLHERRATEQFWR